MLDARDANLILGAGACSGDILRPGGTITVKLREFQAKEIFRRYGLSVPDGEVVSSAAETSRVAAALGCAVVIKPQLGVKGRGKVGGILFADTPDDAASAAERLLGVEIKGETVRLLLVEARAEIAEELYAAVAIDPAAKLPVLVASRCGGVDIEEVARTTPERVVKRPASIIHGPSDADLAVLAEELGTDGADALRTLYQVFADHDAETVEVNPLVRTSAGNLVAVDAVLNVDEDALFRHPELAVYREAMPAEDPIVEAARERSWTYIALDGDIAILSSGAGLTMAILDLMQRAGGSAANFLDTAQIDDEGIYEAFALLARARPSRAILVNIFAGLNRCDLLAEGITRYLRERPTGVPVVVRMIGNREDEGYRILRSAGIDPVAGIEEAVREVVRVAGGAR